MSKLQRTTAGLLILASTMLTVASCYNDLIGNDKVPVTIEKDDIFPVITRYKWSIDPDILPDGSTYAIYRNPDVDHLQYFAFNRDSTVDRFEYEYGTTGTFHVDGNIVTCLFVETVRETDSVTANDGDYNAKVILEYKDDRLYNYDKQRRLKNNKWVSFMPPEYKKLYYRNAGYYANRKYNLDRSQYKSYDTTANALTVVERFNWRCETYYENGKRNGIYKKYMNNKLSVFGTYTHGQPTGIWYFFLQSGEIRIALKNIRPAPKESHTYKYIADIYSQANGLENYYLDLGISVYLDEQMNLHYDE